MTEQLKLTPAAKRDLATLRRGERVDFRVGPLRQLVEAGLVTADGKLIVELVPVKVDPFVGARVVDYDGSVLVIGEPVAEPYLGGYRVLRNTSGDELDQSYHEDYLATLPLAAVATSA